MVNFIPQKRSVFKLYIEQRILCLIMIFLLCIFIFFIKINLYKKNILNQGLEKQLRLLTREQSKIEEELRFVEDSKYVKKRIRRILTYIKNRKLTFSFIRYANKKFIGRPVMTINKRTLNVLIKNNFNIIND